MKCFSLALSTFAIAILLSCGQHKTYSGGVEAKDALSTYRVADGFKIEMIASEPLISDPVDMEIDESGRMYVVEMHGYPLDKSGSGRIMLVSDNDGDGIMDESTVFRDGLLLPTGILRWKNGVIVTDAPNVLYLEDADGDSKAEILDTLLTGFALTNPQHNMNNPVYGLDNWIYVAHEKAVSTIEYQEEFGDRGREITFPGDPAAPVLPTNANGRSIRFKPVDKKLEMTSTACQFGQTFDRWGHWFGCNNSNVGYHEVIANRYLEQNPGLLVADAVQNMSEYKGANEVFPITTNPDRQLLTDVGVVTSACGITAYLGNAFPEPYNANVTFIAEPVSNLVRADFYKDSGASFTAHRVVEQQEFLASTDAWARPVNCYVGPDGALYVLDYYRQVIESPEWMSKEAIAAGGLYNGSDRGRIFRITPTAMGKADWTKGLQLGKSSLAELVEQLKNKNSWWRTHAQRLIVDRGGDSAVPYLKKMLSDSSAVARLHALWTLEGLDKLSQEAIQNALSDTEAGIRENAIRLAEIHLQQYPDLSSHLVKLQNDANLKVKLQLLLTLGYVNTQQSQQARSNLLFKDIGDKWIQVAALTSSTSNSALLNDVLVRYSEREPAYATMVARLATMIGSTDEEKEVIELIQKAAANNGHGYGWQPSALEGLSQGLKRRKEPVALSLAMQQTLVNTFFNTRLDAIRSAAYHVIKVSGITDESLKKTSLQKALSIVNDKNKSDFTRALAVQFLSIGDAGEFSDVLSKIITSREPPAVQLAVVRTFSAIPGTTATNFLINEWRNLNSEVRTAAIQSFVTDVSRIKLLLSAIEEKKIEVTAVSFGTSVQLMLNKDSAIREKARVLFTKDKEDARRLSKEYQQALDLKGNAVAGREVYVKNCAICHQLRGKSGVAFGPDLGTVRNWMKEDILANIVDPNLSISSGFDLWSVELNNGEVVQGVIVSETAAITLRNNGQLDRTISRQEIKSIRSTNMSAMPSGLAKNISYQQMADLISFLREN
ncbi:MAG: c-type cytochrome [Chitinophagaceae bacterium]|nr:c-type cytochrome [Chitinophagaceae bacterium]